jgi:hypothetical protein
LGFCPTAAVAGLLSPGDFPALDIRPRRCLLLRAGVRSGVLTRPADLFEEGFFRGIEVPLGEKGGYEGSKMKSKTILVKRKNRFNSKMNNR